MTWAALASGAAFMDAPALRATLDAIHASLASPPLVMQPSHSHGAERERITSALRGVVSVLQAIDLEAHRALTGHVSVYRSTKDSDALRTFVTALGDALARRVLGGLGERTLRVLCELLESDVPDLLGILGRGADENAHSRWRRSGKLRIVSS